MHKSTTMFQHLAKAHRPTYSIETGVLRIVPFQNDCFEPYYELNALTETDAVSVAMIWVAKNRRDRKYGEKMLTQICFAADLHDVALCLIAISHENREGNPENRTADLVKWYKRHSFQETLLGLHQRMVRRPNFAPKPPSPL